MSISVILPMSYEDSFGARSFKDYELGEAIRQNLKFLLFTRKGEYTNDANFGIGIQEYLFDNHLIVDTGEINSKILEQASRYMPYIKIESIKFETNPDINKLNIQIKFYYNNLTIPQVANFFVI